MKSGLNSEKAICLTFVGISIFVTIVWVYGRRKPFVQAYSEDITFVNKLS
jgi:hypothetical protein